jgi:hypothetical protein
MKNNNNNWNAFGREFASCLNDIEEDFKKLPRWQRMFFHRQIRKAAREEKARENQAMRAASAQKRKKNNNKRSSPVKKSMWAPRK